MKPNAMQVIVALFTAVIATVGTTFMCLYALWKIYVDVPLLLVLSNITIGALSSLTTLLVGRTVSQLNQNSDVTNRPQIQADLPLPPTLAPPAGAVSAPNVPNP